METGSTSSGIVAGIARSGFDSIVNFRDLGGLIGAGGRRVAVGRLFRSGNPGLSHDADRDRMAALGLDEILDLRAPDEKLSDRALDDRFSWTAIPIVVGDMRREMEEHPDDDSDTLMLRAYGRLSLGFEPQFRAVLERAEQGRTFLVHCAAGKDRTGMAVMLLLSALGVSQEQIVADFVRSNDAREALLKQVMPMLLKDGRDPATIWRLLGVQESYLRQAIGIIEQAHGSVERYLTGALGVDVTRIRGHYLEG